jgi:hypothetical protein
LDVRAVTLLCPGNGPSAPKAGVAKQILYSAGGAEALALFSGAEWFSPWAALLGQIAYNVTENCAADPPGYPTLTVDDFAAAINYVDPVGMFSAIAKIRQWVETFLWYANCQCTGATTPANPVPKPPADMPAVVAPVGSACYQLSQKSTLLPPNNSAFVTNNISCIGTNVDIKNCTATNPTSYYWVFSVSNDFPSGPNVTFTGQARNAGAFRTVTKVLSPGASGTLTMPYQAGDDLVQLSAAVASGSGNNTITAQAFIYCNGVAPNVGSGSCCPPDPSLLSMLNQIFAQVTLLQRYRVPFAYVPGAAHSGLTGTGTLTVPNGLIGLQLDLTTQPNYLGEQVANPNLVYDAGWWSVETVDSVVDERRIRHASQQWLPPFMSTVTRVGYALSPGVVARIVELEAET